MPDAHMIRLANGREADVLIAGEGPPLVLFHGDLGRRWDAFHDALAADFRVHAPRHPGSTDTADLDDFRDFGDLSLFYDDLMTSLGLDSAVVVGHGFGGMAAAEFTARHRERVERLVLISSLGLWRDEDPIPDLTAVPRPLATAMRSASSDIQTWLGTPPDGVEPATFAVETVMAQAAAGHFSWPIPDRALRDRLYRIVCPTQVIWGADDAYVSPTYLDDFATNLPNATPHLIPGAGHLVHLEATNTVATLIRTGAARS